MAIRVTELPGHLSSEREVHLDGDAGATLGIHPWDRGNPEVYLSIEELGQDKDGEYANIIVPREEFVEAILAVFPELTRA